MVQLLNKQDSEKAVVIQLKVLSRNLPAGTEENHGQDVRFPGQDLNQGPSDYEAIVLTTRPERTADKTRSQQEQLMLYHGRKDRPT
jgi:hypothetical protein